MQFVRRCLVLGLAAFALNASAQQNVPQAGSEYQVLTQPQAVTPGNKIEVTEFFGYFCGACNAFDPYLEEWVKKQGDRIVMKRVHADFDPSLLPQQKLYYTLEAMGLIEKYQSKAFAAVHLQRNRLSNDEQVMEFVTKSGIDKAKFESIYKSFAVQSQIGRGGQMIKNYKVSGVPTIAIDGRFIVSPGEVAQKGKIKSAGHPGLAVMDFLVEKARADRKIGTAAPAAAPAVKK
jgi:thiol:disulfide interchange protein DsbA